MFETATATLDWLGVIVFTVAGALVASRKEMDFVGFAVLGTVTGVGGGTLRDLLLGQPVFWTQQPAYLLACVLVSCAVFFVAHIPQSRYRYLVRLDALGLALFTVAGAEKALQAGASATVAIVMTSGSAFASEIPCLSVTVLATRRHWRPVNIKVWE